jgi:hypothetical protein
MKYSKGIMWLDDCRIPFVDEGEGQFLEKRSGIGGHQDTMVGGRPATFYKYKEQQGRFTPNLLVCDDMLNDGVISKSGGRTISKTEDTNIKNNVYNVGWVRTGSDVKDSGSSSRYYDLDKWFDKIIDNL